MDDQFDMIKHEIESNGVEAVGTVNGRKLSLILELSDSTVKLYVEKNPHVHTFDRIKYFDSSEEAEEYFERLMDEYDLEIIGDDTLSGQ